MATMSGRSSARVVRSAWLWSWLWLSALLLGGCGPGVGGTGTGDTIDGLNVFGASAVPVCVSDLAVVLACPSATAGGGGGAVALTPGTAPVYLADTIDGQRVAVSVQGNAIEVNAPCARVQFRGQWGAIAGQAARFYGSTGQDASTTATTPATLQAVVRGNGLELTLIDTQGRVLLGPVLVTVRPAPAAPGACG